LVDEENTSLVVQNSEAGRRSPKQVGQKLLLLTCNDKKNTFNNKLILINNAIKCLIIMMITITSGRSNLTPECGPMPNVMAAQPNTGGALCSMPQSLADAHY